METIGRILYNLIEFFYPLIQNETFIKNLSNGRCII